MTEYHRPNNILPHKDHHSSYQHIPQQEEITLEDSISSILSSQRSNVPILSKSRLQSSYRKAAKAFINRRFFEAFAVLEEISENAVILFNNEQIKESMLLNVWSLYLNLLDLVINKGEHLPAMEQHRAESLFFSSDLFEQLDRLYGPVHPKLMVQLLLIKLNNSATDLKELRERMDYYMVNNRVSDDQAPEFKDFQELLELYHVYLLAKLGEYKEAEHLIRSNPLIFNSQEMIDKLYDNKKKIEEEKSQKAKLAKLKKQQELKAKQKAQELLNKKINDAKRLEQEKKEKKIQLSSTTSSQTTYLSDDLLGRFISLIKAKFTNRSTGLVFILSLISFILVIQKNKWLMNSKIRRYIQYLWEKVFNTFKMAFSITYL